MTKRVKRKPKRAECYSSSRDGWNRATFMKLSEVISDRSEERAIPRWPSTSCSKGERALSPVLSASCSPTLHAEGLLRTPIFHPSPSPARVMRTHLHLFYYFPIEQHLVKRCWKCAGYASLLWDGMPNAFQAEALGGGRIHENIIVPMEIQRYELCFQSAWARGR